MLTIFRSHGHNLSIVKAYLIVDHLGPIGDYTRGHMSWFSDWFTYEIFKITDSLNKRLSLASK